jgi:Na+/H+ antiporter NhaC
VGAWIPPVALPAALLGVTMFVAFSTGTSWGTYAVLFPVAIPLAWSVNPDPGYLALCFAAVTGGSVFGDQCSPISDTTILSSLATGCDLMDHVLTQLPMALGAAGIAATLYTLLAGGMLLGVQDAVPSSPFRPLSALFEPVGRSPPSRDTTAYSWYNRVDRGCRGRGRTGRPCESDERTVGPSVEDGS